MAGKTVDQKIETNAAKATLAPIFEINWRRFIYSPYQRLKFIVALGKFYIRSGGVGDEGYF